MGGSHFPTSCKTQKAEWKEREEERRVEEGGWGGKGMREWSKKQTKSEGPLHTINNGWRIVLDRNILEASWQTSDSIINPWLLFSLLYKNVLQMFLYSSTPTWNCSWLKHEILPFIGDFGRDNFGFVSHLAQFPIIQNTSQNGNSEKFHGGNSCDHCFLN